MRDYSPIDVPTSLRVKGYGSKKAVQIVSQAKVMGTMVKLEKLKSSLRQINVTGTLKIELISKLRDPGVIVLWSPVGAFALFGLILSLTLLFIQLIKRINFSKAFKTFEGSLSKYKCLRYLKWLKRKSCFDSKSMCFEFK